MYHKSQGILLRKVKLTGGGFIVKIFTAQFGIRSYFGRTSKQNKNKYLPLSIVHITGFQQPKKTIYSLKEYELAFPFRDIYQNIYKSNVLIFINEVLNQVIQEEEANPQKFTFLESKIMELEKEQFDPNFHLLFLVQLTSFLGFEPDTHGTGTYYDYAEGELTFSTPTHSHFFDQEETVLFQSICKASFETNSEINLSNMARKRGLQLILTYYRYHTEMRELKSLPVLEMIFS